MMRSQGRGLLVLFLLVGHLLWGDVLRAEVGEGWEVRLVGAGRKALLEVDTLGRIHVMGMTEDLEGEVWHAVTEDPFGAFTRTQVAAGYYYGPGDLLVDAAGTAHLAWHNHEVEHAQYGRVGLDGEVSGSFVEAPGHDGWDPDLAIAPDGTLWMSSVLPSLFGATESLGMARHAEDGSWDYASVPSSSSFMYGFGTSFVIDGEGTQHVLYCNATGWVEDGPLVWARRPEGGAWGLSHIVEEGPVGRFPMLVIGPDDALHAAWLDVDPADRTHGFVRYARLAPEGWQIEDVGELEDLDLGMQGARHSVTLLVGEELVCVAAADRSVVELFQRSEGAWSSETVYESEEQALQGMVDLEMDPWMEPMLVTWESGRNGDEVLLLFRPPEHGPAPVLFHRGDPDGSGVTDISDGIRILNWLFVAGAGFDCMDSGDTDDSGVIDISDGIAIFTFLFLGGPPPAPPGPPSDGNCGTDPQEDGLGCSFYPPCAF